MEPIERVITALQHKEPDKVPIFLLFTTTGANILSTTVPKYFASSELVVKGQLKLQEMYGYDCVYPFFYASKEYEAFGGVSLEKSTGPPESGIPVFSNAP